VFPIKDFGELSYFLGVEALWNQDGLHLRQTKYITDMLNNTYMLGARPLRCPSSSGSKLSSTAGDLLENPTEYRRVIGAFQYCTITRPDISYSMNQLCQFMHSPHEIHWIAVKRVLRYLKGTIEFGLLYIPGTITMHAYYDSDWANNPDDRRSTTSYGVFLGTNLISWCSKRQSVVSRSSTEAEYRSMTHTTAELYWLYMLFQELQITLSTASSLWCDNVNAIALASNLVFHSHTKHIEIDYHFVREKVVNHDIQVQHTSTQDQIADVFTKGHTANQYCFLRDKLCVCLLPHSLKGDVRVLNSITTSAKLGTIKTEPST
jgi:hypothetical protein